MARARNIKPSFFTNEQLADNDPLGRLLFIGLWTIADYNGNLEWKPRTIKIQILPWDNCDIRSLAINLDNSGLIRFYSNQGKIYINITNFIKHQNPHINEKKKGSLLPQFSEESRLHIDFESLTINPDFSRVVPEQHHTDPADSLLLIPDSPTPIPDYGTSGSKDPSVPILSGGVAKSHDSPPAKKPKINDDKEPLTRETWGAYYEAYYHRYGAEPVRNATITGQLAQFVKRIGKDEAPHVAAFFVHHNNQFYVTKMHPVGLLLADGEKLRTEWATKRTVTATQARQIDRKQTTAAVFDQLMHEQEEKQNVAH